MLCYKFWSINFNKHVRCCCINFFVTSVYKFCVFCVFWWYVKSVDFGGGGQKWPKRGVFEKGGVAKKRVFWKNFVALV